MWGSGWTEHAYSIPLSRCHKYIILKKKHKKNNHKASPFSIMKPEEEEKSQAILFYWRACQKKIAIPATGAEREITKQK